MGEDRPDPFVVRGKDSLAGLSPASVERVRAFYRNYAALKPKEMRALGEAGMAMLPDRGRWLAWSTEEDYFSLTVMPRLVKPSKLWDVAVQEAQKSLELSAATLEEEYRERLAEEQHARAAHRAAEERARSKGRLWGRWTGDYKVASAQAASLKVIHAEARDRAAAAGAKERAASALSAQLGERTQIAANVMSQRWTGWSCVGRWEDPISSSDVRKIAAALVIGQTTVGLMLSDLISDGLHRRLLEPWQLSVSRVPWSLAGPAGVDDLRARTPAASRESTPVARPDVGHDVDERLAALLALVQQADGIERISYRDEVAGFGRAAIEPMSGWLTDPRLGAFATRVLEKIAAITDAETVDDVLRTALPHVSTPSVKDDIATALGRLEPQIKLGQAQAWMATQGTRADGSQWTIEDATRLVEKAARLDARRASAGKPALSDGDQEQAWALQFTGLGSRPYVNHCWRCGGSIDSEINARCDQCSMFFCDACGACMCGRN